jgi:uridine phosphorylase
MEKKFCLSSEDVIRSAIKSSNKKEEDFEVDPYVIIFFSKFLLDYLKERINIEQKEWLDLFHPYASGQLFRGYYHGMPISAISPPMGASPISSVIEDLIFCGAKVIFLVCGSWGIGKKVKLLDYLIPTHGLGPDGASIYYGRKPDEEIEIDKEIIKILIEETKKRTKNYHIGKNYSTEALYRIKCKDIYDLQKKECISMENGELNVLGTICKQKKIKFGAIFYSYYNPLEGWAIPWLESKYKDCVNLEAEIALATIKRLEILMKK